MTPISEDFIRHLRADGPSLAALNDALSEWATQADLPPRTAFHLDLILDELLTNIVEHGVPVQDDEHATLAKIAIEVRVRLVESGSGLEVCIRDDAQPFNPLSILQSDIDTTLTAPLDAREPGGLGIHFVKTLTQALQYTRHPASHPARHPASHPAHSHSAGDKHGHNELRLLMRTGYDVSQNS